MGRVDGWILVGRYIESNMGPFDHKWVQKTAESDVLVRIDDRK